MVSYFCNWKFRSSIVDKNIIDQKFKKCLNNYKRQYFKKFKKSSKNIKKILSYHVDRREKSYFVQKPLQFETQKWDDFFLSSYGINKIFLTFIYTIYNIYLNYQSKKKFRKLLNFLAAESL